MNRTAAGLSMYMTFLRLLQCESPWGRHFPDGGRLTAKDGLEHDYYTILCFPCPPFFFYLIDKN